MDLHWLRDLLGHSGPFATVYADATHDTEQPERLEELRWRDVRDDLARQGTPEPVLRALDAVVPQERPPSGPAGRLLVANEADGVLLDRTLPEPPDPPRGVWALLPDLLPVAAALPEQVPTVVVRVDETGGEVLVPGSGKEPVEAADRNGPVHKVRAGGPSHLRMQERVEEAWRRNAAEVAARVDEQVRRSGARLLVLAGDARSRSRLLDALPERSARVAVEVDHSGGASDDDLAAAVEEATRDVRTTDTRAELDRWEQAEGRPDGLPGVVAAARAGAVDTLFVDLDAVPDTRVWIGADLVELGTTEDELTGLGVEPVGEADAGAALLRAAAGAGTRVQVVGGGRTGLVGRPMADGVGAVLRFPVGQS